MIIPVEKPNLPSNNVSHASVSRRDELLDNKLKELGITPVYTIASHNVDSRISEHSDLFLFKLNKDTLLIDKSQTNNLVNFLTIGYNSVYLKEEVKSPYPSDCLMNALILKNFLFYNKRTTAAQITDFCSNNGMQLIEVNQGYIKCSVCPIADNALITDDISVCKAADKHGIDVLYVNKGSVHLKGYEYGFIGGCTGLINKNKLLFNGDINLHEDCNKIIDFLQIYNVTPEIIKNKPLTDIGSIIPLTEYKNS